MFADLQIFPVLPAADLDRAKRWYEEKLGLTPVMDMGGAAMYRPGGTPLLVYHTDNAGTARNTAAGWVVPDLEAVMAELRGRGVTFEEYDLPDGPKTVDGVAAEDGSRSAWFTDSEGNILALTQLPAGASVP